MRALVCYSVSYPKLKTLAEGIAKGLETRGHSCELLEVRSSSRPVSMGMYDLLIVGSPSLGFFGGRVDDEISGFVDKCSRLEGKKAAAFVPSGGFGSSKSLTTLMKAVEKQGAIVVDFAALAGAKEAIAFGAKFRS